MGAEPAAEGHHRQRAGDGPHGAGLRHAARAHHHHGRQRRHDDPRSRGAGARTIREALQARRPAQLLGRCGAGRAREVAEPQAHHPRRPDDRHLPLLGGRRRRRPGLRGDGRGRCVREHDRAERSAHLRPLARHGRHGDRREPDDDRAGQRFRHAGGAEGDEDQPWRRSSTSCSPECLNLCGNARTAATPRGTPPCRRRRATRPTGSMA